MEVDLSGIPLLRQEAMQINAWLEHRASSLKIRNFVIINDCNYGFKELFEEHVVLVDESFFSETYAEQAYKILKKPPTHQDLYIKPDFAKLRLQSS